MITEDYVSFEIAKLLKEKRFEGECVSYYSEFVDNNKTLCRWRKTHSYVNVKNDAYILVPTLQMTMKWLREVYNIHINIDVHWLHFANQNGWMYIIAKILENGTDYIDSKGDENDKHFYSTYEEACETAIKYCLENLI